jgi:DNA repair exonuclease SbcCD ATPase subunit
MPTIDASTGAIVFQPPQGLDQGSISSLEETFGGFFAAADKWRNEALAIQVTDAADKKAIAQARAVRLELKALRVNAEKARKVAKEESLRKGKAIDGIYNALEYAIVPLERHLQEQEDYAERMEEQRLQALRSERAALLAPYGAGGGIDLASLSEEQFAGLLQDAKDLHTLRVERERKAEEERLAKAKADAEERERIRLENLRLREEAAKLEAEAARALAEAAALRRAEEARVRQEEAARAEEERERRRMQRAPDKVRLEQFQRTVAALNVPLLATPDGAAVGKGIRRRLEELNSWLSETLARM